MKLANTQELDEYRLKLNKIQTSDFATDVCLYGVYERLNMPVVKFVKLSKRYLYDEDGEGHSFGKHHLTVFTSGSEAWRHFVQKLKERNQKLEAYYEKERQTIEVARKIFDEHYKESPHYFI